MPGFPLFPAEASTFSWQTDSVFFFIFGIAVLVVLLIGGTIVYFAWKYHRRSEDELPPQIHGSDRLELAWTVIPLGVFMVFFVLGARVYLGEASPPSNSENVYVVAKQWMWKFEHSGGQSEINELHVPIGRPIKLTMTSQDVIHSFFVPAFRIHQDVLPDRETTTWFQATQLGQYHLFCSQYCGTGHSAMTGYIIVMTPADYQAWLSGTGPLGVGPTAAPSVVGTPQSPAVAAAGQALFTQNGCDGCHVPNGSGVGPSFVGLYGKQQHLTSGQTITTDDAFLRACILTPDQTRIANYPPVMPSYQGKLSDTQLLQIIAYIQSLQSQPPVTPIPGAPAAGPSGTGTPSSSASATTTRAAPTPAATGPTAAVTTTAVAVASPVVKPTATSAPLVPATATVVAATETTEPSEEPARPSNPGGPGPAANLTGDATRGEQVYNTNCAVCHGPQGKGGLPNPGSADGTIPPLNPIDPTLKSSDPKVFATNLDLFIEHGSTPEGANPAIKMPAWGDTKALTPQQIADVIAYIMSLNR